MKHLLIPSIAVWKDKQDGGSYSEIARKWHCTVPTIVYHVKKIDAEIFDKETDGAGVPGLAVEYGVTEEVIKKCVAKEAAKDKFL